MLEGHPGPVGVFDSGVGGLTVVRELFRQSPGEDVLYFGDTAHLPYGPRPVVELISFAGVITSFLVSKGAKVVLDACNSTSSVALDFLQDKFTLPILGVVTPGVEEALRVTRNGRIGLIATEATVRSGAHRRLVELFDPAARVFPQACPLLVPLVEEAEVDGPAVEGVLRGYLAGLQAEGIDTLILGCTHYPYLAPLLGKILGPRVTLVNPALQMVARLAALLRLSNLSSPATKSPEHHYYVSSNPGAFREVGEKLLGEKGKLANTRLVNLKF